MNILQMINQTKQQIVEVLNGSKLPIEMMDLVLENILLTVRNQALTAPPPEVAKEPEVKEAADGTE